MASLRNSQTVLLDLKVQLKKAKVDVKALSTLAQQGDEKVALYHLLNKIY